jgi:hypothetical protein
MKEPGDKKFANLEIQVSFCRTSSKFESFERERPHENTSLKRELKRRWGGKRFWNVKE